MFDMLKLNADFKYSFLYLLTPTQSTNEGKDQESIQSSTTPDPGHYLGVQGSRSPLGW